MHVDKHVGVCATCMWTHMSVCYMWMCACTHTEANEGHHVSCCVALYFVPLRQGLS